MDIWLLPSVGRQARRASQHPAEPLPPPAQLFGMFLLQDSLSPQQEEIAVPLRFYFACFCLVFVPRDEMLGVSGAGGGSSCGMVQKPNLVFAKLLWPEAAE